MNKMQNDMVRKAVRDLAKNEIMPFDKDMDQTGQFPWHIINEIKKYGLFGVIDEPKYGGAGLDPYAESILIEELSYACPSISFTIVSHSLGSHLFSKYSNKELKEKYMKDIASGDKICCFAITEPSAGSDAASIECTAALDGDEWVINGHKTWITNYSTADIYLFAVKTDQTKGSRGISVIMVKKGNQGLILGHKEDKMGVRGSDTGEIYLENCRVPKENLIGELGKGFKYCMEIIDIGRALIGAMSIGIIRRSMHESVKYANERKAFGQNIGKFQGVLFKIADMKIALENASALNEKVCEKRTNKLAFSIEAACLKAYASVNAVKSANSAIQIHGGNGYSKDFIPERLFRDARILEIGEGTTEIQKMVIGNSVLNNNNIRR